MAKLEDINKYIYNNPEKLLKIYLLANAKTAHTIVAPYGLKILIDNDLKNDDIKILEVVK